MILLFGSLVKVMKNQEAVNLVKLTKDPQTAAKRLTSEALGRMSKDDISCIVIRFRCWVSAPSISLVWAFFAFLLICIHGIVSPPIPQVCVHFSWWTLDLCAVRAEEVVQVLDQRKKTVGLGVCSLCRLFLSCEYICIHVRSKYILLGRRQENKLAKDAKTVHIVCRTCSDSF
jgi:hypothetical protein